MIDLFANGRESMLTLDFALPTRLSVQRKSMPQADGENQPPGGTVMIR